MLSGLLFAIHDAEGRGDRLAATLPFGGVTLIEYQARLLIAAGASQIVVVVARLTPELLGAIGRIARRGVAVDAVRTAAEAAAKLHPLSRVLMLADGLITTEAIARGLAGEGGDTLLVVGEEEAGPGFERLGGRMAWAGVARLRAELVADVAALPRDYDLQSALLRAAAQAHAAHLLLPPTAMAEGHGIERSGAALDVRGRAVLAGMVGARPGWFDSWLVGPIARAVLPPLLSRGVSTGLVAGIGGLAGLTGLAAIWFGFPSVGLVLALLGTVASVLGDTLASLRDEEALRRVLTGAAAALPSLALLLLGLVLTAELGEDAPVVVALVGVAILLLGERAIGVLRRAIGWGAPGAYLLIATLLTAAGWPVAGLSIAALYAFGTLAAAVETLRRQA